MTKTLFGALFSLFLVSTLNLSAQIKRDTLVYPMIFADYAPIEYANGTWVDDVKKANGFRLIISPDTINSKLFIINDCFLNGDMRFRGKSIVKNVNINLHGTCIEYYNNGAPKAVSNYSGGNLVGDAVAYYPNGKLYFSGKYNDKGIFEMYESRDSLGKSFVSQGNGEFKRYDVSFSRIIERGFYENSLRTGEWKHFENDTTFNKSTYENGILKSGNRYDSNGIQIVTPTIQIAAKYKEGMEALYKFLFDRVHYTDRAKQEKVMGKTYIGFTVEKDGSVTDVKVLHGVGFGLDEQVAAVIKLTTKKWDPAMEDGEPVKSQVTLPFNFSLETIKVVKFERDKLYDPYPNAATNTPR